VARTDPFSVLVSTLSVTLSATRSDSLPLPFYQYDLSLSNLRLAFLGRSRGLLQLSPTLRLYCISFLVADDLALAPCALSTVTPSVFRLAVALHMVLRFRPMAPEVTLLLDSQRIFNSPACRNSQPSPDSVTLTDIPSPVAPAIPLAKPFPHYAHPFPLLTFSAPAPSLKPTRGLRLLGRPMSNILHRPF